MANLIRNLRTKATQISLKTLIHHQFHTKPQNFRKIEHSIRSYTSYHSVRSLHHTAQMRKAAFEEKLLRLIRNEIRHKLDRSPPEQFIPKCGPFAVDERPGEQWIMLKRKYGDKEDIKIEVTMFDGFIPSTKPGIVPGEEQRLLHITFVVNIHKEGGDVMEFLCSAWPDSIEIERVYVHGTYQNQIPAELYRGPVFKELDDELQESLYEFLEARGISDDIAAYLHKYMAYKDKAEYIRWLGRVKSYVEQNRKTDYTIV